MFWWQFLFCPLTRRPSASECKSPAHNRITCNLLPKSTDFALPRSGVHPLSLFAQAYLSMQIQFRRVSESAFPWTSSDSLVGDDWLLNKVSSQIFRHRSAFSKIINPNKRQLWGPYHWNRNLFHIANTHCSDSRWRNLGQTAAGYGMAKGEKCIWQFWQIHIAIMTNPSIS